MIIIQWQLMFNYKNRSYMNTDIQINIYITETNKGKQSTFISEVHSTRFQRLASVYQIARPPLLSCVKYWVLVVDSPPQAVCSTCFKYQLNLKTKEHLLQMKIKHHRSTVRELVLGVKGRKKDDVIQVLLRHASDCQL